MSGAEHQKHIILTVKHGGGSLMLCGCYFSAGPRRNMRVK